MVLIEVSKNDLWEAICKSRVGDTIKVITPKASRMFERVN